MGAGDVDAGAGAPPDVPAPVASDELPGAEPEDDDADCPAPDVAAVAPALLDAPVVLGVEAAGLAGVAGLPNPDGGAAWVEELPPVLPPGEPGPLAEDAPRWPGLEAPVSEAGARADVPGPPDAEGPGGSAEPGPAGPR
jgi:hypothetical protein